MTALPACSARSRDDPHSLLLGRLDATGRVRYVGHTPPLPPPRRRELELLLRDLPQPVVDHEGPDTPTTYD